MSARRDVIRMVPYDSAWAGAFAEQAALITPAFEEWLVRPIEHIGSTSIPGLAAKPIIDMLAVVRDIGEVAPKEPTGWVHAPEPIDEALRKLSFCHPSIEMRTHHLHVVEERSDGWRGWLAFRDRLRTDAAARDEYAALKRDLAERFGADPNQRDAYRSGKAGFIKRITDEALS